MSISFPFPFICRLKGVESAKDTIFPSRVLRRELEVAQKKMVELESELEKVKKAKRRRSKVFTYLIK